MWPASEPALSSLAASSGEIVPSATYAAISRRDSSRAFVCVILRTVPAMMPTMAISMLPPTASAPMIIPVSLSLNPLPVDCASTASIGHLRLVATAPPLARAHQLLPLLGRHRAFGDVRRDLAPRPLP